MKPVLFAISILSSLTLEPAYGEQIDSASLAAGLESSSTADLTGKSRRENLGDPRWTKDEVQKAVQIIFKSDAKAAPASESATDSER